MESEWEEFMGPDICLKRISPGTGNIAELKDIVKANIKVYINEETEPVEILNNACFKIGEGDAVPGLELALRHSREKEILKAKCTWKFGFGLTGRQGTANFRTIPEKSDLLFDIEILEHIPSPESGGGNDIHSILRDVEVRKESGNRWFSYGDFTKAGRCFSQGGKTGDSQLQLLTQLDDSPEGKAGKQLLAVYLDCLNNLAACHLNLNDPFKARESCIRVLELDPNNHRGLLRAGKASLNLHEYEESKLCLTKLLEIQEMELNQLMTNTSIPSVEGTVSINEPLTPETLPLKIEELKKGIVTTKQWISKVELAKKKYREREKGMANKIAKGLFVESKKESEQQLKSTTTTTNTTNEVVVEEENKNNDNNNISNDESENEKQQKEEQEATPSVSSFQLSSTQTTPSATAPSTTAQTTTTTPPQTTTTTQSQTMNKTTVNEKKNLTETIVTWVQDWLSLIAPLLGVFIAMMIMKNNNSKYNNPSP